MNLRWRPSGDASKPPCGAVAKIHGVERTRKKAQKMGQVWIMEMNVSEPLMKY